jgi:PAS domain S-box-containing protein
MAALFSAQGVKHKLARLDLTQAGGRVAATVSLRDQLQGDSALRENEERLRLAIEATGIGTWDVNVVTGERRWSNEFRAICGLPPEAPADPKLFSSLIHPDDRDWVNERYRTAYMDPAQPGYDVECRIRRFSDGAERWVMIKGHVFFDSASRPLRGVGTLLDVTDRKRTAEALAESEERYRLAVAAFHGATYETDLETQYAYRAPRAYEMLGFRPEEGEPTREWWFRRIHPEDAPRFHAALEALFSGEALELDIEFRIRHASGDWIWVWQRGLAVRDGAGRLRRTVGAILDITQRKRAEAALRESEARFRHMADSAPALIWMTDAAAQVTFANMHFEYLFGRRASEMLGNGWRDVIYPDDLPTFAATAKEAFATRQPLRIEVRVRDKDDEIRVFRCEAVARLDDAGAFLGYTGCAVDVTDVRAAHERQQLLINELNHRVKNTLATVQSIAAQTLRGTASPEQAKEVFESRLMALSRVHDVLTRESWEGAALGEIVAQAIEPYRDHGAGAFAVDGPDLRLAPSLALALAMALQELVTNAVKYGALSQPTGRVSITWSLEPSRNGQRLHLRWSESGGPPVRKPKRRGFGSRLIERSLAQDPNGRVELTFPRSGVVCEFHASA